MLAGIAVLLYLGVRLAIGAPQWTAEAVISLSPRALPLYASLSLARMTAAYVLSLLFTFVYGYVAAYNRRAEQALIPLLDVLQSVPILSFLPIVLLGLGAILPQPAAAELTAIVLIFTSQVWNLTFAWYQSLTTIPKELREASSTFRFNRWLRLKTLELPFGTNSLIWNSVMSWAGGWFFLMAAETFTVGQYQVRLPGLGSYLNEAAQQGDMQAIAWGIAALVLVIVLLDQVVWRPLLAWSGRFRLELVEGETSPTSWVYQAWRTSRLVTWLGQHVWGPASERLDALALRYFPMREARAGGSVAYAWLGYGLMVVVVAGLAYGAYLAGSMLLTVSMSQWAAIGVGLLATFVRVLLALAIALAWTIPVGVAIGAQPRLAAWLQPVVQVIASVPATALFPVLLLFVLDLSGGLNLAAVLLMLLGMQWYVLFNVIAGAAAIPQDLKSTAALLQFTTWQRWRVLTIPALLPYLVTGAITATGGAWNASIVAEYVEFDGQPYATRGIGAVISLATAAGDYPLLLAATLSLVLVVVALNRLVWRRLYRLAEERYRME